MQKRKRYINEEDIVVAFDQFMKSVNSVKSEETERLWEDAILAVKTFITVLSTHVKED